MYVYICIYMYVYIMYMYCSLSVYMSIYIIGIYRSPKSVFIQVMPKVNKLFDSSFKVINN